MVGNKKLHPNALVMAMGNLDTDNAYVNEMPAHTKSRQIHLYVEQDIKEWEAWALDAGLDNRVVAMAISKPSMINRYDPNKVDINYPCARTMEVLSEMVKGVELDRSYLPLLEGIIGNGAGLEFYNFCMLAHEVPSIREIEQDPANTRLPTKASHKYFVAAMLADAVNVDNGDAVMQYLMRMGVDYQYFTVRSALFRSPSLRIKCQSIGDWLSTNSKIFNKYGA